MRYIIDENNYAFVHLGGPIIVYSFCGNIFTRFAGGYATLINNEYVHGFKPTEKQLAKVAIIDMMRVLDK